MRITEAFWVLLMAGLLMAALAIYGSDGTAWPLDASGNIIAPK